MSRLLVLLVLIFFIASYSCKNINGVNMINQQESQYQKDQIQPPFTKKYGDNSIISWIDGATRAEILKAANGTKVSDYCYLPLDRELCAPQFIIAGSMKCGTTSLHTYLLNHPQVLPLRDRARINGKEVLAMKEIRFFNEPVFSKLVLRNSLESALTDYYDLFRPVTAPNDRAEDSLPLISGDATPMYVVCKQISKIRIFHNFNIIM